MLFGVLRSAFQMLPGKNRPTPPDREQMQPEETTAGNGTDRRRAQDIGPWELLREDFATYDRDLFEPGLWAVLLHRFGTRTEAIKLPPLRKVCDWVYRGLFTGFDWKWGINLPRTVDLGRRVRIWHSGCMLLVARSIGDDVHIRQATTFGPGPGQAAASHALPVIEAGADIGSGCCVLGAVKVGRHSLVGANSVVLGDVPAHANVLGIPSRTVPPWSLGVRSNAADGSAKGPGLPLPKGDRSENPPGIGLLALLAEDFRTHERKLTSGGFWALAVHRLGNWRMSIRTSIVRAPLTLGYRAAYHTVVALWGIDLPYNAKLGRRLRIGHHGGVVLGAREVGNDVQIRAAITVGLRRRTDPAAPTIGHRVQIDSNACIIGNIHVGDDSIIGPNTVLARDVPPGSTMLGVPGRRINPSEYIHPAGRD